MQGSGALRLSLHAPDPASGAPLIPPRPVNGEQIHFAIAQISPAYLTFLFAIHTII